MIFFSYNVACQCLHQRSNLWPVAGHHCPALFRAEHSAPLLKALRSVVLRIYTDGDQVNIFAQSITQARLEL